MSSRQQLANRFRLFFHAMEGRQTGQIVFRVRIKAERSEDCGEKILLVVGLLHDVDAVRIRSACDDAALQAAAGHHQAPGIWIMIAATRGVQPRGAAEFTHRNDQRGIQQAARFKIVDEMKQHAIEFRHQHLVNLVLEDVVVPVHAVGDHHERRAVFHEMPRHERMLGKTSRAVTLAVPRWKFVYIEEICAGGHPLHALECGVLAAGDGAVAVALEFRGEKFPERLARLAIMLWNRFRGGFGEWRVISAESHRGVFSAEPARPVSGFEGFELVAAGNRVNEDEVRNRRIQLSYRLRQCAPQRGPGEARPLWISALQEGDRLQVLRLRRLHAAHNVEFVRNARAVRHE